MLLFDWFFLVDHVNDICTCEVGVHAFWWVNQTDALVTEWFNAGHQLRYHVMKARGPRDAEPPVFSAIYSTSLMVLGATTFLAHQPGPCFCGGPFT